MNCPNCNVEMSKVKTRSHYDIPVILDQCPKCGGLWFEKDELFRTKYGEAKKIEPINTKKLKEDVLLKKTALFCPSDGEKLKIFQDPNFPKDLQIESCLKCGNFWFNKGEFRKFQKIQTARKKDQKKSDEKAEKQIENLLGLYRTSDKYNTLGKLGNFLATPISRSDLRPIGLGAEENGFNKTVNLILGIVRVILMIFARR